MCFYGNHSLLVQDPQQREGQVQMATQVVMETRFSEVTIQNQLMYQTDSVDKLFLNKTRHINLSPKRSQVKMAFATSIKPEQPASNSQSVQVLCCLLLISN
ncbi:hypothetical protein DPMN_070669 [Dreissena polymorpha]|uniref:Uncharacterized protein n=1 Tax=Dreissena polymorpha TaxID=45954 RepID=A0A9D4BX87_DREPO|nr:hypothetical protein DPMN_070669 [Dreissena polymorpha]